MGEARLRLRDAKRVVIKVGTSTLTHEGSGKLNLARIEHLIRELSDLMNQGREVVLVSSGAIAAGLGQMGLAEKPGTIPEKQALAAIGQGVLMHIYEKIFAEYGKTMAQVLLTKENAMHHHQYLNSRNALLALLAMGVIPVINENDVVAIDEIKIGDNDNLSAIVATLVDADALILLTDIDGLYTGNPQTDKTASLIPEIAEITPEVERMAGGAGTKLGTGGMLTKLQAAKVAVNAGVDMVIAPGARESVLRNILAGETIGTFFPAKESHLRVRKSWIAFGKRIHGDILVDEGCARAMLRNGSSLLAAGIVEIAGEFTKGNTVRVLASDHREIARGIVNYDAESLRKIIGHQTAEFPELLAGEIHEEVIHRDNMVLMA